MKNYGLVGKTLSHSFSADYFKKKFESLGLKDHSYHNFELDSIQEVSSILSRTDLEGFSVTVPYKTEIISFLDELDPAAKAIGAVNTVKREGTNWKGYNTDWIGFSRSIAPFFEPDHSPALILGTGGASKAVAYSLAKLNVPTAFASRTKGTFKYAELSEDHIHTFRMIVNCTPVGMHPNVHEFVDIPYEGISTEHLVIDLIYNPDLTQFLSKSKEQGATILNGYDMLVLQAEAAWKIWQD